MAKKKAIARKRTSGPRSLVSEREAVRAVAFIRQYLDKPQTTRAEYREAVLANRLINRHITEMAKVQREREQAREPKSASEKILKKMLRESKIK